MVIYKINSGGIFQTTPAQSSQDYLDTVFQLRTTHPGFSKSRPNLSCQDVNRNQTETQLQGKTSNEITITVHWADTNMILNEQENVKHILHIHSLWLKQYLATGGHRPPVRELPGVLDKNTCSWTYLISNHWIRTWERGEGEKEAWELAF